MNKVVHSVLSRTFCIFDEKRRFSSQYFARNRSGQKSKRQHYKTAVGLAHTVVVSSIYYKGYDDYVCK
jgi:hypothetical protein